MSKVIPFPEPARNGTDAEARAAALDAQRSVLVEAPAGSGKTGLMVQRFLRQLLEEEVTRPSEVLAITFTRKATAELLERVVKVLEKAHLPIPEDTPAFDRATQELARKVRERSDAMGWDILRTPASTLNIRSIDSACMAIASAAPVLSGIGGPRKLTEDAEPLYRMAARRTLFQLGRADDALNRALRVILLHRDGNLEDTERLLAQLLASRELWGELIPLRPELLTEEHLDSVVRPRLEAALEAIVCEGLEKVRRLMPGDALEELSSLANAWSTVLSTDGVTLPLQPCGEVSGPPGTRAESLEHWRALIGLLLTKQGLWRKSFARNHIKVDLPKGAGGQLSQIVQMIEDDRLATALQAVLELPPAKYPDEQWEVAKSLFHVLRHALIELKLLFAERGESDFAEVSLAARAALDADPTLGDPALAGGDARLRHLLVDEMQDTSAAQYDLLQQLTRSWDGQTQTLFVVGDPKQSIYMFRQARVERFLEVMREGMLGELHLATLNLRANFRTQANLVSEVNALFDAVFPSFEDVQRGDVDVPFAAAEARRMPREGVSLAWHTAVLGEGGQAVDRAAHQRAEAREIVELVRGWRSLAPPPDRKPWSIAVLASTRSHMTEVAAQLRAASIPFRAVDVEPLGERIEVLDCVALTRALMHPADRTAWLAVLRAPWCGLSLNDLLLITGEGPDADRTATVAALLARHGDRLSPDGRHRLERTWPTLESARAAYGSTSLASLVERTWRTLGGDLVCDEIGQRNAKRYFQLLAELEVSNGVSRIDLRLLETRLARLYAEESILPADEPTVELMTIHRAKGLEWDFVVVPSMERPSGSGREELLNWIELDHIGPSNTSHVLLAPIQTTGEPSTALNAWIRRARISRQNAERKRIFYVACTRAREELHLFGAAKQKKDGDIAKPTAGTLLSVAWPAIEHRFGASEPDTTPELVAEHIDDALAAASGLALAAGEEPLPAVEESPADGVHSSAPLKRLRMEIDPAARFRGETAVTSSPVEAIKRPEGSLGARAFGNVVHRALELAARRLASGLSTEDLLSELPSWQPRLSALLRSEGLPLALAASDAEQARLAIAQTLESPVGRWILSPHPEAFAEWTISQSGGTLRADRTFLAGAVAGSVGTEHAWIVDFKTTRLGSRNLDDFVSMERATYEAQMERYAAARRSLLADGKPVHLALYYPLNNIFIAWDSIVSEKEHTLSDDSETSHVDGIL